MSRTPWFRYNPAIIALIPAVLAIIAFWRPPFPNHDFIGAMRAWDWWRLGGSFHHIPLPPPSDDLSSRPETLLGWWSPGTYLPTSAIEGLGIPMRLAISFWLALGTSLGILGWHRLWRSFGFDQPTAFLSAGLTAVSWHALYSYIASWRYAPSSSYRRALLTVGGVTVAAFTLLFLRAAAVIPALQTDRWHEESLRGWTLLWAR